MADFPQLLHTVLDTPDVRRLAEFYRQLLGLQYRPGDEAWSEGEEGADWLVLTDENGRRLPPVVDVRMTAKPTNMPLVQLATFPLPEWSTSDINVVMFMASNLPLAWASGRSAETVLRAIFRPAHYSPMHGNS
jgi:hypothetical protein